MKIRTEHKDDVEAIYALTQAAFKNMPFSDGTEGERVNTLRNDGDLKISLVAIKENIIIGHIAFSPVLLNDKFDDWYGLGPISVSPDFQKQGIGKALIKEGFTRLKDINAKGCILIGDPTYYSRFGFIGDGHISYRNLPKEIVQWLSFNETSPHGILRFSHGLDYHT